MTEVIDFGDLELDVGQKLPFFVQASTGGYIIGWGYLHNVIADPVG